MSWKDSEQKCYLYIKNIYKDAILQGGSNSCCSDIFIPSINKYIEIKDLTSGCRFGQFVEKTASKIEQKIISEKYTQQDLILGAKQHYKEKNVEGFCVKKKNGEIEYFSFDSFFYVYQDEIFLQSYYKRSGSRKLPKKDISILSNMYSSFYWDEEQKRGFISDSSLWNTYSNDNKDIAEYYINEKGEVRKRGKTKTFTYLYAIGG